MTYRGLITYLHENKDKFAPARYKRIGRGAVRERLLSSSEIKQIRSMILRVR